MIKLDLKNLWGIEISEVFASEVENAYTKFLQEKENLGFAKLVNSYQKLEVDLKLADEFSKEMDTIVVIGIGGSDLGTRAIFRSLKHQFHNFDNKLRGEFKRLFFIGDTTDPKPLKEILDIIDLPKTLFLVVSKSGNTIEQASVFVYLKDLVSKELGDEKVLKHFVFLTDFESGTLREIANSSGYKTISIPSDVGGRFSVLSSVGMVPAHLVGLNVQEFLRGAAELDLELGLPKFDYKNEAGDSSSSAAPLTEFDIFPSYPASILEDFLNYIFLQYSHYRSGRNIHVLMPYEYSLYEFAKWFRQLWAESLGKRLDIYENEVFEGITPVAALGPTDQHSQLQLYNEGPSDKIFTFISVENSSEDLKLPGELGDLKAFDFLKGRSLHQILNYEMQTTAYALTKNQRPNATIVIPKVDEYHLGQLFYLFEVGVVIMGYLLNINPFDQPGVELSKNAMYGVLGKSEYEKEKYEFDNYQ